MAGRVRSMHAFFQDGWHVLHLVVVMIPLGFGIILALPGQTFALSVSYRVMAELMAEGTWGALSIACGLTGLLGLVSRDRNVRLIVSAALATWHGTVAICVILSTGLSTGATTYGALAFGAYSLAWNGGRHGA